MKIVHVQLHTQWGRMPQIRPICSNEVAMKSASNFGGATPGCNLFIYLFHSTSSHVNI